MLFSYKVDGVVRLRGVFDFGQAVFYPERMDGGNRVISPPTPAERGRVFGGPNND